MYAMCTIIYKGLICYRVFFIGLGALALVALAMAWVQPMHHVNL